MVRAQKTGPLCAELQDYLSGQLDLPERLLFEDHLSDCHACSEEIAFWHELSPDLEEWKQSKTAPEVTQGDIYRLLSDAAAGKKPVSTIIRPGFAWSAAGACAAALTLVLVMTNFDGARLEQPRVATRTEQVLDKIVTEAPVPLPSVPPQIFETAVGQTLTQQVAADTIGLASNSQVVTVRPNSSHTKYRVQRGTAAFKVDKRAPGGTFVVEVAAYRVEVLGTEFSVSFADNEQIEVAVRYGSVRVFGPNSQSWILEAGERLGLGATAETVKEPAAAAEIETIAKLIGSPAKIDVEIAAIEEAPEAKRATRRRTGTKKRTATVELGTLKQWLAAGETERALKETERYLESNPRSGPGWMLLGDCHRKQRSWTKAIEAYERTMKSSVPRLKSRAMYQAANLYQQKLGQHQKAIQLYEAYLQAPAATKSLTAVAKLNLAKSLIATGNKTRAKQLLEQVVQSQKDNYLSKNAKEILSKL